MKNLILVFLVCLPILAFSQTAGTVQYEEVLQIEIKIPEGMDLQIDEETLRKMIPKEQKFQKVLYFNKSESLYKDVEVEESEDDMDITSEDGGFQFKMMRANMDNRYYQDYKAGTSIEKNDFMGKTFLIKGESDEIAWKMTGKQAKIGDYVCMQATFKDDEREVEAWFTPQIQASTGPDKYGQLPGLILKVKTKSEHGERTITATDIELKKPKKNELVAPKKGKEVTKEEYKKIIEEKMKEMKEMRGGGVQFRIGH